MSDLICQRTMTRCQTPDMCAPFHGCAGSSRIATPRETVRKSLVDPALVQRAMIWYDHAEGTPVRSGLCERARMEAALDAVLNRPEENLFLEQETTP